MDHKVSKDMISSGMTPSGEKTQADLGRTQYGSAPSPSRLMDAYKSMYQNQEKENLDEMKMPPKMFNPNTKGADLLKKRISGEMSADQVDKAIVKSRTKVDKDTTPSLPKFKKTDNPSFKKPESKSMVDTVRDRRQEVVSDRRERVQGQMKKAREQGLTDSVDLLSAYRAVYEHHQKDKDGNTIPHEDEEVNEGKIPAGLQAYLDKKKGKKEDKKEVKEESDMFDSILEHYLNEGYQREDILKAMSSLSEEPITLATIGGLLAKGGAMAAKGAAVAGKVAAKGGAMAAKGLASAGKTVAANVGNAAKGVASVPGKISSGVKKVGGAVKNFYGNEKISPFVKQQVTQSAIDMGTKAIGSMKPRGLQKKTSGTISASADLFDIVKGQLLDEGLSEEEIKDIMLTLTPDEIMEELSDIVKKNDAINKANAMKAAQERKVPDKVREASKRQYTAGGPKDKGENKYTTQDKKTIIDYHKNKGSM